MEKIRLCWLAVLVLFSGCVMMTRRQYENRIQLHEKYGELRTLKQVLDRHAKIFAQIKCNSQIAKREKELFSKLKMVRSEKDWCLKKLVEERER